MKNLMFLIMMTAALTQSSEAAIPKHANPERATSPVSELQVNKEADSAGYEQDYQKLSGVESRYAESWEQQQKILKATRRSAPKVGKVASNKVVTKKKKR